MPVLHVRLFVLVVTMASCIACLGNVCPANARIALNDVTFATSPYWYVLEDRTFAENRGYKALVFRQYAMPVHKGARLDLIKNIHLFVCSLNHLNYISISLPDDMAAEGLTKDLWDPASKTHVRLESHSFSHAAEVKAFEVFIDLDEVALSDFTTAFAERSLTWAIGPKQQKVGINFEKPGSRTVKKIGAELQKRTRFMKFSFEDAVSECEQYRLTKAFVFSNQRKVTEFKYWVGIAKLSCTDVACQDESRGATSLEMRFGDEAPYITSKKECEDWLNNTVSTFSQKGIKVEARCVNVQDPREPVAASKVP